MLSDMRAFGAPFCRQVEAPLEELKRLIASAEAQRFTGPALDTARSVFKDVDSILVYVAGVGADCDTDTQEVLAAIRRLRSAMVAVEASPPPALRPDFNVPEPFLPGGTGAWLKNPLFFVPAGIVGALILLRFATGYTLADVFGRRK